MGKVKRNRQKLRTATSSNNTQINNPTVPSTPENISAAVNIRINSLNNINDDTLSIKSYKSTKFDLGTRVSKKDKLKLKHNILLHKIDTVNQFKKEQKKRKKRKFNAIIGDTNALHDALPSLDSLLKKRDFKISVPQPSKKKGIAKQSKRKKNVVEGVNLFKKLMSDEKYKKDPLKTVCDLIKQRVKSGNL